MMVVVDVVGGRFWWWCMESHFMSNLGFLGCDLLYLGFQQLLNVVFFKLGTVL